MAYKIISIIGVLAVIVTVLFVGGAQVMSHTDYKEFVNDPNNPPVGIFLFDSGKVEIATKTPGCDYGLYRIDGSKIVVKCGYYVAADFDILTEYFTTYGEDRWLRNDKKRTLITTEINPAEDGKSIEVVQRIPYYKKSGFQRYGQDGVLFVTYTIIPEMVKISLDYKVENEAIHHLMLRRNKLTEKAFFNPTDPRGQLTMKLDNLYIYGDKRGDLSIDPSIQIGNISQATIAGNFYSGYCEGCDHTSNVTFASSAGLTATYYSGWIEPLYIAELTNMTSSCYQNDGGWCSYAIRKGANIYAKNDSETYIRCNMSDTQTCSGYSDVEVFLANQTTSFAPGSILNLNGILINGSDFLYITVNTTSDYLPNQTINLSKGTMELVFIPGWDS